MSAMSSQITSLAIVYSTVYSKRRSNKTSKLRVTGLCEHKRPVMRKKFPLDDVIAKWGQSCWLFACRWFCVLFHPRLAQYRVFPIQLSLLYLMISFRETWDFRSCIWILHNCLWGSSYSVYCRKNFQDYTSRSVAVLYAQNRTFEKSSDGNYWCAILIAHQLLWQNREAPVSIFQESPLAGEPGERLFHIHSMQRYQLRLRYCDKWTVATLNNNLV